MSLSTTDGSSGLPAFSGILSDFFSETVVQNACQNFWFLVLLNFTQEPKVKTYKS